MCIRHLDYRYLYNRRQRPEGQLKLFNAPKCVERAKTYNRSVCGLCQIAFGQIAGEFFGGRIVDAGGDGRDLSNLSKMQTTAVAFSLEALMI
mgnify:CR=1